MGRTGVINAQVHAMQSRQKFSQQTHLINPIGPQTHVLGHFRPIRYSTNLDAKWAELEQLMHKFEQRSCIGNLCNERTQSTPLDPKLMFWGDLDRFVTARTSVHNGPNW
jgi:hypothetical protein